MTWIDRDDPLAHRAKIVLLRMQLLAEGPASRVFALAQDGLTAAAGNESKQPYVAGESLYEDYLPKFVAALQSGNDKRLMDLIIRGETALMRYCGQYKAEMELPTDDAAARAKIIEVYEGVDSVDVARKLAGKVSVGWVELARRRARRDPQTGYAREGWHGWDDQRRRSEVEKAVRRGLSVRRAAEELKVPVSSLHRDFGHYWQRDAA